MALSKRDAFILSELQKDSDRTDREIADIVGVSPAVLGTTKRKLKAKKYIIKTTAVLNHYSFDLNTTGFILIKLDKQSRESVDRLVAALEKEKNVLEIHSILGPYDVIIKVRAQNNAGLSEFVERVADEAGVTTETLVVSRSQKESTEITVAAKE